MSWIQTADSKSETSETRKYEQLQKYVCNAWRKKPCKLPDDIEVVTVWPQLTPVDQNDLWPLPKTLCWECWRATSPYNEGEGPIDKTQRQCAQQTDRDPPEFKEADTVSGVMNHTVMSAILFFKPVS